MPGPAITPTSTDVNSWMYFILGGVPSPGTIPRGGIRGFQRETGWDEKKGHGTAGATLTLTTMPPCKGSITLQLLGPGGISAFGKGGYSYASETAAQLAGAPSADFAAWDNFVQNVLHVDPTKQQAAGLTIYHPQFASVGITSVVVKSYSGPEHVGKGLYHATIELIEWSPPLAVSVVATVDRQAPDGQHVAAGTLPRPPDPVKMAQEIQIQALQAAVAVENARNGG